VETQALTSRAAGAVPAPYWRMALSYSMGAMRPFYCRGNTVTEKAKAENIAKAQSPLESAVQQIIDNPQYLLAVHSTPLLNVLKRRFPELFLTAPEDETRDQVGKQLQIMGESLKTLALAAAGGDTTEVKRLVDAQGQYFRLVAKYNDALAANARLFALESATTEALQEIGNKALQDSFLKTFRRILEEKTEKSRKS
jgi:hypothetical protein